MVNISYHLLYMELFGFIITFISIFYYLNIFHILYRMEFIISLIRYIFHLLNCLRWFGKFRFCYSFYREAFYCLQMIDSIFLCWSCIWIFYLMEVEILIYFYLNFQINCSNFNHLYFSFSYHLNFWPSTFFTGQLVNDLLVIIYYIFIYHLFESLQIIYFNSCKFVVFNEIYCGNFTMAERRKKYFINFWLK